MLVNAIILLVCKTLNFLLLRTLKFVLNKTLTLVVEAMYCALARFPANLLRVVSRERRRRSSSAAHEFRRVWRAHSGSRSQEECYGCCTGEGPSLTSQFVNVWKLLWCPRVVIALCT